MSLSRRRPGATTADRPIIGRFRSVPYILFRALEPTHDRFSAARARSRVADGATLYAWGFAWVARYFASTGAGIAAAACAGAASCQGSTSTRQLLVPMRMGLGDLHAPRATALSAPPRSGLAPGAPMGSYKRRGFVAVHHAGRSRGVGTAAQITLPRSLKTRTRSCRPMPRAARVLGVDAERPDRNGRRSRTRWSAMSLMKLSLPSDCEWKLKRGCGVTSCSG